MSPGRDERFRALYDAELDWALRTLRRLGVPPADVEDLVHDVFVVVHRRLAELEPGRPVRPWLFGIAYRIAGNHFSRARQTREVADDDDTVHTDPAPAADEKLVAEQRRAAVLAALAALDLDQRAVCVMHDLDGVAAPAIARALGVPLNTVYSRLRIARQKVAATLKRMRVIKGEP